tara:strand:+ start:1783 stop:2247 length:465 start_codon:yes stop_codon:yes gene_type:complete
MDPRTNPYAPGAGTPPPELAGRDDLIESASIAVDRLRSGLAAQSLVLYGLRGVSKTVLLQRIRQKADAAGIICIPIEAPEERSLPAVLLPALRSHLIRLSRQETAKVWVQKAFGALAAFAKAFKVKYDDIEFLTDVARPPARRTAAIWKTIWES